MPSGFSYTFGIQKWNQKSRLSKRMPYFGRFSMSKVTKYGCPHWIWNFGLLQIPDQKGIKFKKKMRLVG